MWRTPALLSKTFIPPNLASVSATTRSISSFFDTSAWMTSAEADLSCDFFEPLAPSAHQCHLSSLLRQSGSARPSNPTTRAGDDCNFLFQASFHQKNSLQSPTASENMQSTSNFLAIPILRRNFISLPLTIAPKAAPHARHATSYAAMLRHLGVVGLFAVAIVDSFAASHLRWYRYSDRHFCRAACGTLVLLRRRRHCRLRHRRLPYVSGCSFGGIELSAEKIRKTPGGDFSGIH